jgi:hypothetical protein
MINLDDVLDYIANADTNSLTLIINAVKEKQTSKLRLGLKVKFRSREFSDIHGTVIKINRKSVKVAEINTSRVWNVSPSLLIPTE